ncbi:MAG: 50S ribosomal protein L9 [Chlamydiae bacterium]|nr:50S ribosomal protein L9 [Chlamydiota bacterium]
MKQQLLLLEDVDGLGRSGDLATAKSGFVRNYLLPKRKAVIADKHTLKMQAKLQGERAKQTAVDREASEEVSSKLSGLVLTTVVKVDPEGKMYGSVTQIELVRMLEEKGYKIDKKNVVLAHPVKSLGNHTIELKLPEGVVAWLTLKVDPEGGVFPKKVAPPPAEEAKEEETPEGEETPPPEEG